MGKDRFISPEKPPEGYERELLVVLQEEAAEVIQIASKCLRFGIREQYPSDPRDNAERLAEECGDFLALMHRLEMAGILDWRRVEEAIAAKELKLDRYLQCDPQEGSDD